MLYAKKAANPAQLLQAAMSLHDAAASVSEAMRAVNGVVKVKVLDDYAGLITRLRIESMRLENDFANRMHDKYGVTVASVPLFGSGENLDRAREFLNSLVRGG